jgi:hypothetical protein
LQTIGLQSISNIPLGGRIVLATAPPNPLADRMGIDEIFRDIEPADLRADVASQVGTSAAYHALIWMGRMLAGMPDADLLGILESLLLMEDYGHPPFDSEDDALGARIALRVAIAEIAAFRRAEYDGVVSMDDESIRREINRLYWLLRPGLDEQEVRAWMTNSSVGLHEAIPIDWINARRPFERLMCEAALNTGLAIGRRVDGSAVKEQADATDESP